ncbi:unnamed protein product, partial [Sphacelaria rigidula]
VPRDHVAQSLSNYIRSAGTKNKNTTKMPVRRRIGGHRNSAGRNSEEKNNSHHGSSSCPDGGTCPTKSAMLTTLLLTLSRSHALVPSAGGVRTPSRQHRCSFFGG